MEGNKIFKAGEDSYKSQWKLMGRILMLCVRSCQTDCHCLGACVLTCSLICLVLLFCCVHVMHVLGESVMHAIDNLKMYQLSGDTPPEHLGFGPRRGTLVLGSDPEQLGLKISSLSFFPGCIHATLLFHVWCFLHLFTDITSRSFNGRGITILHEILALCLH